MCMESVFKTLAENLPFDFGVDLIGSVVGSEDADQLSIGPEGELLACQVDEVLPGG